MIAPRLILLILGTIVALLGIFGGASYFNNRRPSDLPTYRAICVVAGIILILAGLFTNLHRH